MLDEVCSGHSHSNIPARERVVLRLDEFPWSALWRAGIGCVMLVLFSSFFGSANNGWGLILWILTALLALRLIPTMARQCISFSPGTKASWSERRQLAKRFDSYQWQKMFWLGIGFASYMVTSGELGVHGWVLTVCSLISGAVGIVMWRRSRAASVVR